MQLTAHLVELDPAPFNFRSGLFDQFAWIIHLNQRALECVSTAVYIYISVWKVSSAKITGFASVDFRLT